MNPATQGSSLTEGKRSKRSKKAGENGDANNSTAEGDSSMGGADDALVHNSSFIEQDDEDDDNTTWSADVSEAAVRARMHDLTDGAKTMTISDDSEKTEKERVDLFYEFVKTRRDANQLDNVQVHRELVVEADRLDISHKAPLVLAELLFSVNIIQEVRKHRNLLLRFTHNNQKAQRYLMGYVFQSLSLTVQLG